MTVVPTPTLVARPLAPIVTAAGLVETQVTVESIFAGTPLELVPIAVNCMV